MLRGLTAVVASGLLLLGLLDGNAVQAGTLTQIPPTFDGLPGGAYPWGELGFGNSMTKTGVSKVCAFPPARGHECIHSLHTLHYDAQTMNQDLVAFGEPTNDRVYVLSVTDTSNQLVGIRKGPSKDYMHTHAHPYLPAPSFARTPHRQLQEIRSPSANSNYFGYSTAFTPNGDVLVIGK